MPSNKGDEEMAAREPDDATLELVVSDETYL